jgi:polysaccharide export outer membrane protein
MLKLFRPSFWIFIAGAVCLSGCAFILGGGTEYPPPLPSENVENYKVRPHDVVVIDLFREPDVGGAYPVSIEGEINAKLLNRVKVVGLTVDEIKLRLTERYKEFCKDPSVAVRVEYTPRYVYFDGFIGRPGQVPFLPFQTMTFARAVANAGGISPRGSRQGIKLIRIIDGQERTFSINMDEIHSGEKPDFQLADGDRIYVSESLI